MNPQATHRAAARAKRKAYAERHRVWTWEQLAKPGLQHFLSLNRRDRRMHDRMIAWLSEKNKPAFHLVKVGRSARGFQQRARKYDASYLLLSSQQYPLRAGSAAGAGGCGEE